MWHAKITIAYSHVKFEYVWTLYEYFGNKNSSIEQSQPQIFFELKF